MSAVFHDLRTLYPYARALVAPERAPPGSAWGCTLADPVVGSVRLSGTLRARARAEALVLIVHGLAGSPESPYCRRAARVADELGLASLCLALRGADRRGEDFYNVALRADVDAALTSPELAGYRDLYLLGFSMGGYVALHCADGPREPRLRAVAAVCTPIDLAAAQRAIDAPRSWLYRRHVLGGLKAIYRAVAARGRALPSPLEEVLAVRTIREWDCLTIAPRYGFDSPEHYYSALSIAPGLRRLGLPALLLAAEADPLVPAGTIRPFLPRAPGDGALEVRWVRRAGHLAFPRDLDLGTGPRTGLEGQLLHWLTRHGR